VNLQVNEAENPALYYTNPNVIADVDNLLSNCRETPVSSRDLRKILAFLAAKIVYPNGHRPGVVQNMMMDEFEAAQEEDDDRMIIVVHKHKTAASLGPISAVVSKADFERMTLYKDRIRITTVPLSEELSHRFFLTYTGNEFKKVNEWIQEVSKLYDIDVTIPNPTIHRKWIDSTAHGSCTEAEMRVLNGHMSHSEQTSKKYYQKQKAEHALQSVEQINHLSKRYFTTEEDTIILTEYPLTADQTPSLMLCQQLIDRHNQLKERSKKHIQDRWRVLKKKKEQK